ncbi:MAG: toluene hydroxylase [Actinomycetota bacterium]|nr:toluene hydroxylase [Actinomycetota bacterium]
MSSQKATPQIRTRSLKTWSAFGNLGRRPTEYEITAHNMNHTTGAIPLELGPDVNGNAWLLEHRDATKLRVADWDLFRDPAALTYGKYVAEQDDQETYIELLLEQFDRDGADRTLSVQALDMLGRALAPSRYLGHGLQMLSAYLQQLASSSYVANCAAFQTADQLRRVQLNAYRTTQLNRSHPDRGFATSERGHWENDTNWQPIRRAVELALVEFDWDRALVATNLVVKPVADLLLIDLLGRQLAAAGDHLDALMLDNLWRDSRRSQSWTAALTSFLLESDSSNGPVLQGYLDEFAPLGFAMIESGVQLLSVDGDQESAHLAAGVRADWATIVEAGGLRLGTG